MAQKTIILPELGEVVFAKRRGAKNLRLSISAAGKVRVGMPAWAPYSTAIRFVEDRAGWIKQHLEGYTPQTLHENDLIGKAHRLHFIYKNGQDKPTFRISGTGINVYSNLARESSKAQLKAVEACEKALRKEASHLLPQRLQVLAIQHKFAYKSAKIRKLTSRWGSCSSEKNILLSYYLIQLPWDLIDYVLIHELLHTEHLNHGEDFWEHFKQIKPDARALQKQIRSQKPILLPNISK